MVNSGGRDDPFLRWPEILSIFKLRDQAFRVFKM